MKVMHLADFEEDIIDNRFESDGNYVYITLSEITDSLMHALAALHLKYEIQVFPIATQQLQVNFREKTNAD